MTARSRMTQRAHVQRLAPGAVDDSGNPSPGTWATHIAAMPCWLYGSVEREAVTEERIAVVANLKLLAPLSADVNEQDRLGGTVDDETHPAIVDRRGTVIEAGMLFVETVLRKRTHLQLTLSRVTA